jgi:three-Cys-motif partner protein
LEARVSDDPDFFETQSPASRVKAKIVAEYFKAWARIMAKLVKNHAKPMVQYVDLYCGPGKYEDGNKSTPLLVLEHALADAALSEVVLFLFNDRSAKIIDELKKNISELPGIAKLTHRPRTRVGEIDDALVEKFANMRMLPTFSFLDPFGYKDLTLKLVDALAKHFGSDMVLFFSFDSINRALTNPKVKVHIDALFGGQEAANKLREAVKNKLGEIREEIVIEAFVSGLKALGYEYIVPYVFERDDKDRTSHYLIFISKNSLGFKIMKAIMYAESEHKTQGVARFGKVRSVGKKRTPLLELINAPLDGLCEELCREFAGQTITRKDLCAQYEREHSKNPFVEKNYREALLKLESEGRIETDPPRDKRPKRKREPTFGESVLVTFPKEAS